MEGNWSKEVNGRRYNLDKIREMVEAYEARTGPLGMYHEDYFGYRSPMFDPLPPKPPVVAEVIRIKEAYLLVGDFKVLPIACTLSGFPDYEGDVLYQRIKPKGWEKTPIAIRPFATNWESEAPNYPLWASDQEVLKHILKVYKGFLNSSWDTRFNLTDGTISRTVLHPSPQGVTASVVLYNEQVNCLVHGASPSFDGRCYTCEKNVHNPDR